MSENYPSPNPIPCQLNSADLLEHFDMPSMATSASWKDYPESIKDHKERNHPLFIRKLIRKACMRGGLVYDPMCGIGTVQKEASRIGRIGKGWDVRGAFRDTVESMDPDFLLYMPGKNSVDAAVTSPSYLKTNKSPGRDARSQETARKVGSKQGTEWAREVGYEFYDISMSKNLDEWWRKTQLVVKKTVAALKPGGKLVWVVRERIERQQAAGFVKYNLSKLSTFPGLKYLGYYSRTLYPGAWQQLQCRKYFLDTGRAGVYGDKEYAMVFKKT